MTYNEATGGNVEKTGALWELTELGQSVWVDYIRRGILENGELAQLIRERAVRGVTSNPAIFEQAIAKSDDYDDALVGFSGRSIDLYEQLAVEDIQAAADLFRDIYDDSDGGDGFVSLEVSPELARDAEGSLTEARRLWKAVDRPNVMIKIPGTEQGLPAIRKALSEGINVNITLLFSLSGYEKVMEAYLAALEDRVAAGDPIDRIGSVASFFVSRVDTAVDAKLDALADAADSDVEAQRLRDLRGRAAIANARLAYARFREIFSGDRWAALEAKGARVQRPLWASTSTKNPDYRDVLYVEELIGPDTVNTMPLATLEAFADHGIARPTVDRDVDQARELLAKLNEVGIDFDQVTDDLQEEGVEKFVHPFRGMLQTLDEKVARVAAGA